MPVPNPVMPVKGAGTTLWVYKGSGDPYANPLSDVDWSRLAKVKDLTPGELTAESYDDSYLDDEDADWTATGQGQKSAGDTSFTLAWMPGEQGQQALLAWFNEGDTRAYKIRYLDFFKGEIGKTHLAQELWTQIDNGQLAPDLAEIRTSITDVSNEITQTVNKKLEDQSAAIQQIQKVQVDTNNNLNSMWAVKLQQMQDGRLYIAGIGAGIENTPDGMQSQVLLAADRIAMINPANGNTKPMFVGQGDQIFMNEVFLKYLTAPTITSGGNPPAFSLTPDGKLTAKNADISGSVNANAGTLNNVTINENCQIKGKLSANQIEGDIVKTVGKAFPRDSRAPERWPSGTITVRIYDDQPFDRQIVIPAVAFSGAKHEREHTDIYSSCRLIVKKNGAEIYNRTALDNTLIYSGVIDMPAGHGHMTLEFSVSAWLVNDWYPTASISDLLVVVMKKATAGISIS